MERALVARLATLYDIRDEYAAIAPNTTDGARVDEICRAFKRRISAILDRRDAVEAAALSHEMDSMARIENRRIAALHEAPLRLRLIDDELPNGPAPLPSVVYYEVYERPSPIASFLEKIL